MPIVYRALKVAREDGIIPWDWIIEETGASECVSDIDFNDLAIKGIRSHQLRKDGKEPIAVVVEVGLGDGMYKVEARYEDLSELGRQVAEIRIKFLPHPQFPEYAEGE